MKKKIKKPKDLVIQTVRIATCTYDRKGVNSIRLLSPNGYDGILMGPRSAKIISKWLLKASEWVKSGD